MTHRSKALCPSACQLSLERQSPRKVGLQAYEVLSDSQQRFRYNQQLQEALMDAMDDFTGQPYSKWLAGTRMGKNTEPGESRAVFVVRHFSSANQSRMPLVNG